MLRPDLEDRGKILHGVEDILPGLVFATYMPMATNLKIT